MVKYTVSKRKSMKKRHMRRKRMFGLSSRLSKVSNKFKNMSTKKKAAIGAGAVGGVALISYELLVNSRTNKLWEKAGGKKGEKLSGAVLNDAIFKITGKPSTLFNINDQYSRMDVIRKLNMSPLTVTRLSNKEIKEAKEDKHEAKVEEIKIEAKEEKAKEEEGVSFGKRRRRHRRRSASKRSFGKKRRTRRKSGKKSYRKHRKH